jgi:hypothetical protein
MGKTQAELVDSFAKSMKIELKANEYKGDWRSWNDVHKMLQELDYHEDKLSLAIQKRDKQVIKEHLADCANFLLMIGNSFSLYD